ncbi:squalene/phytoene synthase family protein [Pseudenhygromyxa sp. WMMC2535]|uniref:phytoene/squalene synthase family protein n=1 Tax=Pseudenhygromyxa sp. WMMC2535 TaxID=2712867 RepID=UPI001554C5BE|nr:squalene/phytoene synthase family protein [Pseudenhygromyxa sp. WMMC2535]NVB41711.1 squalene/phytoene synthase family protein [Pseudenhygromyxa sp. WMMC2535]
MAAPGPLARLREAGETALRRLGSRSGSNFKFAFLFLGPSQRRGLETVYGFCRVVDDIVDDRPPGPEGRAQAEAELDTWMTEIERIYSSGGSDGSGERPEGELAMALAETVRLFELPRFALEEIVAGCAMDLDITTYADLEALELYCYRVASCVGILCLGIFGDQSPTAQRYAKHLGLALQYTNILRDIGEDAARGRVYLPLDLLARHGLGEQDMLACRYDERFLAMAEEFADIAEREYQLAWAELAKIEDRRPLLPAEIMGRTYYELLAEIRAHRYNVFTYRASLRRRDKLKVAGISLALTALPHDLPGPLAAVRGSLS